MYARLWLEGSGMVLLGWLQLLVGLDVEPVRVAANQQGESGVNELGAAEPEVKVCPECAEEVKPAARVCRFCGFRFVDEEPLAEQAPFWPPPPGWEPSAASLAQPAPRARPPAVHTAYAPPATASANGAGTAAGVLGIVGFVLSWIPLLGILIGLLLGALAVIFGAVGLARPPSAAKGMATAGLILGIVTIVFKLIPGWNVL